MLPVLWIEILCFLDQDPEFGPNLDPDPCLITHLYYQFEKMYKKYFDNILPVFLKTSLKINTNNVTSGGNI